MGLNDGLVYASHFSGNIDDWSGGSLTPVINGTLDSTTDKNGNSNSALYFDNGDYIDMGTDVIAINSFTISFWFKASNISDLQLMIGEYSGSTAFIIIGLLESEPFFIIQGAGGNRIIEKNYSKESFPTLSSDTWYFFSLSASNDICVFWLNNTKYSYDISNSNSDTPELFYIGKDRIYSFTGTLDELRIYNRLLSDSETNQLYLGYDTEEDDYDTLSDGLLVGYHFSNDLTDFSGNGRDAYDVGGNEEFTTDKNSVANSALVSANGKDTRIINPNFFEPLFNNNTAKHSYSIWVKLNSFRPYGRLFYVRYCNIGALDLRPNSSTDFDIIFYKFINTGGDDFDYSQVTYYNINMGLNTDTWYHFVFVCDNSDMSIDLYKDGTLFNSYVESPVTGSYTTSNRLDYVKIGNYTSDNYYVDGTIDEFRVYNRDLSSSEVSELYTGYDIGGGGTTEESSNTSVIIF